LTAARRRDGFVPLEDYAVIGDGRTVALVARDGQIDWLPIPTLDAPPACAAIVDSDIGGHFALTPCGEFQTTRRYLHRTNVLETTHTTSTGSVRVTDALNVGTGGRLAWTELARQVAGTGGEVVMRWELATGNRFGHNRPWVADHRGVPIVHLGDQMLAVVVDGDGAGPIEVRSHGVGGTLHCRPGQRQLVALVASDAEPLFLPQPDEIHTRLERTVASWRRWSELVSYEGPWEEAVHRSALALKTLLYEPAGALAAAATTSLPESLGGVKNWDYRYSWVRDSSFALDALISLELHEEVHRAVSWLLGALRSTAPQLHVFYCLDGTVAEEQADLELSGYRDSQPVRAGNSAARQLQLGVYGDLFDTLFRYVGAGHLLDRDSATMLAELADRCCDTWTEQDSGIWELPDLRHYTISKIGCWVALDRATRLAEGGHLDAGHVGRWRQEAEEVRAWVNQYCWSERKGAYTFYAGTDDLDAAVLLAGRTGFDRGERLARTVDAVRAELAHGPAVYRYSGMEAEEGAFVACGFWVVNALAWLGRRDEARKHMDAAVGLANDVGLFSEEIDGQTGAFLGNLPQALSHLALINAAVAAK
jgi:GH15 family glucan-1,4-alpha-glucosidase